MSKARDLADLGGVTTRLDEVGNSDGALSNRNLIINGAMQVAQRGTSHAVSGNNQTYTVDRFSYYGTGFPSAAFTFSQDTDAPDGFANSLKVSTTTADSTPTGLATIRYDFEGQDVQRFKYGSSSASELSFSFWVKSTQTGTVAILFYQATGTLAVVLNYTINAANTWEYKTLRIPAQTATSIASDNISRFQFQMCLMADPAAYGAAPQTSWSSYVSANRAYGQTLNVANSTSDTFQITGVQLEVGDQSTPFEHRSYGDELQRCMRYYYCFEEVTSSEHNGLIATSYGTNTAYFPVHFPVEMRATPTFRMGGWWATRLYNNNEFTPSPGVQNASRIGGVFYTPVGIVPSATTFWVEPWSGDSSNTAYMNFDAEL